MPEIKKIIVKPNSPKTKIISETESEIKLAVAAPPEGGKANLELIKFLSKKFGKEVKIIRGFTGRKKIIRLL